MEPGQGTLSERAFISFSSLDVFLAVWYDRPAYTRQTNLSGCWIDKRAWSASRKRRLYLSNPSRWPFSFHPKTLTFECLDAAGDGLGRVLGPGPSTHGLHVDRHAAQRRLLLRRPTPHAIQRACMHIEDGSGLLKTSFERHVIERGREKGAAWRSMDAHLPEPRHGT